MRKQNVAQNNLSIAIIIAMSMFVSGGSAFGQFVVQPMRMDLSLMPKQRFQTSLGLQSFDPNEVHEIDLTVVDLTQTEDGQWQIIEASDTTFDRSGLSSCKSWISLPDEFVSVDPMNSAGVMVNIKVPIRTRGFYVAGIIPSIRPRPGLLTELGVSVRFLVPVFIDVQGRPMRHDVKLKKMELEPVNARKEHPATTNVIMNIDNNGGTRSHLKGFANIKGFLDGHWREITTAEFTAVSIIPGGQIKIKSQHRKDAATGKIQDRRMAVR